MGRKVNILKDAPIFLENIMWLNIKRLRILSFWRVMFFIINFMPFLVTLLAVNQTTLYYIFIIVSFSNMLFIYSRINSRLEAYNLLRQLGASLLFIVFDNIFEIFLVFAAAVVFFLILSMYVRPTHISMLFILFQGLVVSLYIPVVSLIILIRLDRKIREE